MDKFELKHNGKITIGGDAGAQVKNLVKYLDGLAETLKTFLPEDAKQELINEKEAKLGSKNFDCAVVYEGNSPENKNNNNLSIEVGFDAERFAEIFSERMKQVADEIIHRGDCVGVL